MFCWSVDLVLERQWIGSKCSYYKASSYFQVLRPPHLAGELHNFWWIKEAPTWLDVEVQVDRTWKYLSVFATASLWNILMNHSSFCRDCLGRSVCNFCVCKLKVYKSSIKDTHPWCAPIGSQKGPFFETYLLGQGRHNGTFGYWSWKGMEGWNIWQLQAIGLTASSVPYIFMLRIRRFSALWWKFGLLGFLELFENLLIVCKRPFAHFWNCTRECRYISDSQW